jgi:hypothetical protein
LRQRVRVLARQLEVRMLVFDEIHAMLSGTLQTALLTRSLDGAQKVADARPFGLQINPLHHCADERLNLRIK